MENTEHPLYPYGSWPSTLGADALTTNTVRLSEPQWDKGILYCLESRPEEKGRSCVVCFDAGKPKRTLLPAPINVRTRIHEYGGSSYRVNAGILYFCHNDDQRIYRLDTEQPNPIPIAITPEGPYRYSDFCLDQQGQRLIAVCEEHNSEQQHPENYLVSIALPDSSKESAIEDSAQTMTVLARGNDFYSNPRLSPDTQQLSWLSWNHPHMPWEATQCWLADYSSTAGLSNARVLVGDGSESIFQPQWSPSGELFVVSDRSDWWNLYKADIHTGTLTAVAPLKGAEFATPQWVFGMSCYSFLADDTLLCTYTQQGHWHLGTIDTTAHTLTPIDTPFCDIEGIACDQQGNGAFIGATPTTTAGLYHWQNGQIHLLASSQENTIAEDTIATAQPVTFNNSQQLPVHGFFYAPTNGQIEAPPSERPPLLVMCHGGPTGATQTGLNMKIQFWTSRGFAVLDVNYSGSTGYGRRYRQRLQGQWGVLDVDDICCGAQFLCEQQYVDPERLIVRGSSAGGYLVLAALTFKDTFKAGASLYGIGDLSLLATDTHKFESRYLDSLIGPYPECSDHYEARSPLHHSQQLQCPVIFLQGLEDKVVPPNQAEAMVKALYDKQIPTAYITFKNEGHGFRQADNIRYALNCELAFYAKILGFTPADTLPELPFVDAQTIDKLTANGSD